MKIKKEKKKITGPQRSAASSLSMHILTIHSVTLQRSVCPIKGKEHQTQLRGLFPFSLGNLSVSLYKMILKNVTLKSNSVMASILQYSIYFLFCWSLFMLVQLCIQRKLLYSSLEINICIRNLKTNALCICDRHVVHPPQKKQKNKKQHTGPRLATIFTKLAIVCASGKNWWTAFLHNSSDTQVWLWEGGAISPH